MKTPTLLFSDGTEALIAEHVAEYLASFARKSGKTDRRPGLVYVFVTAHPDSGEAVVGYIGQTRQTVEAREAQHRETQPWYDTIIGQAIVVASGVWDDVTLDAYEWAYIRVLGPLYNVEMNRDNPDRVLPWVAVEQRQAREPGWTPVEQVVVPRQRRSLGDARRPVLSGRGRRWRWAAVGWLAVAVGVWIWLAATGQAKDVRSGAGTGVLAASALVWMLWFVHRKARRTVRKRRRRR